MVSGAFPSADMEGNARCTHGVVYMEIKKIRKTPLTIPQASSILSGRLERGTSTDSIRAQNGKLFEKDEKKCLTSASGCAKISNVVFEREPGTALCTL